MPKRIYRRCPACDVVRPALDFKRVAGKPDYGPDRPTRCPECEHVGRLRTLTRAEPPAGDEEGMEANEPDAGEIPPLPIV